MVDLLVNIQNALSSDDNQFGGVWGNRMNDIHKGVDTGEDIKINTEFKFHSGKLSIYDDDPQLTHRIRIKAENMSTGNAIKELIIRNPTYDVDGIVTERQPQELENKILGLNTTFSNTADFNNNSIIDAIIDGDLNTLQDIDQTSLKQITDKAKLPNGTAYTDQPNSYGTFLQTFPRGYLRINDGDTHHVALYISNQTGNFNAEIPQLLTSDFFVMRGITNVFSTWQKFQYSAGTPIVTYRPINTSGQGVGFAMNMQDNAGVETTYAAIYGVINTNTGGSENGTISFQTKNNGVMGQRMSINYLGQLAIGANAAVLNPNSLTSTKTFTFPDTTGQFIIDAHLNEFVNRQRIKYDSAIDALSLVRHVNTAGSTTGIYYKLRNSTNTEIDYANIRAGIGSNASDNVAGAENGQIFWNLKVAGADVLKLQFTPTQFRTYGVVPDFEVGSGDFNSMFIYRPINSNGSNLLNFNMQNASSIERQFGYIGVRSENVAAGAEIGSIQFGAMQNGTLTFQGKIQEGKLYLSNSGIYLILSPAGLTSNREFTFPDVSGGGQVTVNNATQTLSSKTLTSPIINAGQLNGSFTENTSLNLVRDAEAGVAEEIMRLRISDSTGYILFNNATTGVNKFYPRIVAYNDAAADVAAVGMYQYYNILASSDTEDNFNAVGIFDVRRSDANAIQFKRLFQFRNAAVNVFEIYTNKFNFTNKRLENAIFNVDESIIKHSTTNAVDDVLFYDGTRYTRKAKGSNNQFLGVVGGVLGYYTPVANGVLALAGLTDDVQISSVQNNQVLQYDSSISKWKNVNPTSGEANTTANIGVGGVSLIPDNDKSGVVLNFKSLFALSNKILIQNGSIANDRVEFDINEANLSITDMTGSIGDSRLIDIAWAKVTGKPTTFTPSSHGSSHVAGGTDAIPLATTDIAGIVELATDAEGTAGKVVQGSDSRLSDPRTPTNHAANHKGNGTDPIDAATNTVRGTILIANNNESDATKACMSNDSRLSNARSPTSHQSTHALDGSDPLVLKGLRTARSLVNTTPVTLNEQTQQTIHVDAAGGNRTINLPAASGKAGQIFFIQKIDSSSNTVTIDGNLSETINGSTTYVLTSQYQIVMLLCDGVNWTTGPYTTERRGKSTASGNGSSTVFNVPHGLGSNPHDVLIQCSSHNIDISYTTDATNIIVTFASAPPSGTNNVIFHWSAVP